MRITKTARPGLAVQTRIQRVARLAAAALATLAMAVGGVLAAPNPAQAASTDCWDGYFCFFVDSYYSPADVMGLANSDMTTLTAFSNGYCANGTWNDCMSSYVNYTSRYWTLYQDSGYTGASYTVYPWEQSSTMPYLWDGGSYYVNGNDQVSSLWWSYS